MEHEVRELSRRRFLQGAGLFGAGVLSASTLAACAPNSSSDDSGATGAHAQDDTSATQSGWRTVPAAPTEFEDKGAYDVVIVGHGYAGVCSARELAEAGKKVVLLETQPEDAYVACGNQSAGHNSQTLRKLNPTPGAIKDVDPVEFFQNWATITGNQITQGLIMRYHQNMGTNIDKYYDRLTDADFATMTHMDTPGPEDDFSSMMDHVGQIKFFSGAIDCYGECNQTKVQGYNREAAKEAGAEFLFNTRGLQVIMEGDKVSGLYAKDNTTDSYLRFSCKAVIVATGGFAYNEDMLNDLMPDIKNNLIEGEIWKDAFGGDRFTNAEVAASMQYQGDGIKMAHWVGGHLETLVAGMNSKFIAAPSMMNFTLPQAVWVRPDGKRFCNEFYPVAEQRGVPNVYLPRDPVSCVFDSNFLTYRTYTVSQHGFTAPTKAELDSLAAEMDVAGQKFAGTYVEPEPDPNADPMAMMFSPPDIICDDTLEGLAGQLGLDKDEFLAQIERWNGYCMSGRDEEFGRDPQVLFPVEQGPFYASSGNPGLGEIMCTCGGLITDAEQNVLDASFRPIPGLYASGNDCGRRFGLEYITPTTGVSLQAAITLGFECGKSVAKYLG
jgi:hypothetical protein